MGPSPDLSVETGPGRRSPGSTGERALVALFAGVVLVTVVVVALNIVAGGEEASLEPSPSPGIKTDAAGTPSPAPPVPSVPDGPPSLPASLGPIPSVPPAPTPEPGTDPWIFDAQHHRGATDELFSYACPDPMPFDIAPETAYVFGTDTYSDDSHVCLAAVHAGIIRPDGGGEVTIRIRPGEYSYEGSTRNGVTTQDWLEPWWGSYVFVDP